LTNTVVGQGSSLMVDSSGATNGVYSSTQNAIAVYGTASGPGVQGVSTGYHGVIGAIGADIQSAGVYGTSYGRTGVFGWSQDLGFFEPTPPAKTGVYGTSVYGPDGRGVTGQATSGRGVNGIATTGTAVHGSATNGEGVRGVSTGSNGTAGSSASGIASGVYGENTGGGFGTYGRSDGAVGVGVFGESIAGTGVTGSTVSGIAIEGQGRVKFSTAGLVAVPVGGKVATISPGVDLVAASTILCTLESNQAGLFIQRVTKNIDGNTFRVFLAAAVVAGKTAKVGWFVIG
jgi:hypothetical protein